MRHDLEGIEADLERLRTTNPPLDQALKLVEQRVLPKEHAYAALIVLLVEGINKLVADLEKMRKR